MEISARRGQPFELDAYPPSTRALLQEKLSTAQEIAAQFPRRCSLFTTFAASAARGLMRALGNREDWEQVDLYCALTVEPYRFLRHPNVHIRSAYFSPVDRFLVGKMHKSISHVPRQFVQFCDYLTEPGRIQIIAHTCTPPDADGYVNLGINVETMYEALNVLGDRGETQIVLEINPQMPWVMGDEAYDFNRLHLSRVHKVYVNDEALPQLPKLEPSDAEKRIAGHVVKLIEDGDTVQFGIGGVPNYVATHLGDRRELKIHSEMLTDAMVDLVESGVVDCRGKPYYDGYVVGTFAAGSNKLYDWLHRNEGVRLLPVRAVNDPALIGQIPRLKSVNSALAVDFHGQFCSDAIGYKQVSGIGGQLEFVIGAQRSPGGRSIMCLKSTRKVGSKRVSNIAAALPLGTPIAVPRQFADVVVTEWGVAELRHACAFERTRRLISIAHPDFRDALVKQAKQTGTWGGDSGFATKAHVAFYDHLSDVVRLQKAWKAGKLLQTLKASEAASSGEHPLFAKALEGASRASELLTQLRGGESPK
ncbi:MAG: acetyl-CoA hydrolase/transferase C-terminal domain-containing protein [Myxococcota bacterium]|nr:acetyl-CoA hydrolase/transferase C-terminal domain-containing protein [Myxococcota bacterium]